MRRLERKAAALIGAAVLFWAFEAHGQNPPNCSPRHQITEHLSRKYHEALLATGLHLRDGQTIVVEFWVGPEGSFTVLGTNAQGVSCLLMAGEDFAPAPLSPPTESH